MKSFILLLSASYPLIKAATLPKEAFAELRTRDVITGIGGELPGLRPRVVVDTRELGGVLPLFSPPRFKFCSVNGGTSDDSDELLKALKKCNNGGHVILKKDTIYTVAKPLDLRFLKHVDIEIKGTLTFTTDTDYWQANSFKYKFQDQSAFFALGGVDVNVFGNGLIDGQGQVWWDLHAKNSTALRPMLFNVDGLSQGTISHIAMQNSPNWFNMIQNSKNVVVDNIDLKVITTGTNPAKNTDGWDTYRSSNIIIQNSQIDNTDDCVSFKPNSTRILVQNLKCNGSHGISVGSLGQYTGVVDIVEDVFVYNISMSNASDGARIKVWPGAPDNTTTNAGGGSGYVRNILYDSMEVSNVDWAIQLTACYGISSKDRCDLRPTTFTISDVLFKDFSGVTSKKYQPKVATLKCPSENSCTNIRTQSFAVKSPAGTNDAVCSNIDVAQVAVNCTSTS